MFKYLLKTCKIIFMKLTNVSFSNFLLRSSESYFHECTLVFSNNLHSPQKFKVHLFQEGHKI